MHLPRRLAAIVGTMVLGLIAAASTAGSASAAPLHYARCNTNLVVNETSSLGITANSRLCAGLESVTIRSSVPLTDSGGPNVQVFQLRSHATLAQFRAELPIVINAPGNVPDAAAAKAETWIEHHVAAYGGTQNPGTTNYKVDLRSGTYYVADLASFVQSGTVTRLTVSGYAHDYQYLPRTWQTITAIDTKAGSRFVVSRNKLDDGWVTFQNRSDELHFAILMRVKPGTTNAQITDFLNGKGSDPTEPQLGYEATDVISPGVAINWLVNVPPGRYLLICFMTDDMTGMAHAFMGMHTVFNVYR